MYYLRRCAYFGWASSGIGQLCTVALEASSLHKDDTTGRLLCVSSSRVYVVWGGSLIFNVIRNVVIESNPVVYKTQTSASETGLASPSTKTRGVCTTGLGGRGRHLSNGGKEWSVPTYFGTERIVFFGGGRACKEAHISYRALKLYRPYT